MGNSKESGTISGLSLLLFLSRPVASASGHSCISKAAACDVPFNSELGLCSRYGQQIRMSLK